jgi:hypothetical protein
LTQDVQIAVAFIAAIGAGVIVETAYWRIAHVDALEPRQAGRRAGIFGVAVVGLVFSLGVPGLPWWGYPPLALVVALAYAYARSALNLACLLGGAAGAGVPDSGAATSQSEQSQRSDAIKRLLASISAVYLILIVSYFLVPGLRWQALVLGFVLVAPTGVLVHSLRLSDRR